MTDLDQRRVGIAKARARHALTTAGYHARQEAAERAKAATLARTWGFTLDDLYEDAESEKPAE